MKKFSAYLVILFSCSIFSQEVHLHGNFTIRDFFINKDTTYYIEKRHVRISPESGKYGYFMGGYGLKIFDNPKKNEVITVSNELINTVCSVRFFNKSSNKEQEVFYYTEGRAVDALHIEQLGLIVLSLSDKKIIAIDYKNKPIFDVVLDVELKRIARRIAYRGDFLYYAVDSGEIYKHDLKSKHGKILFNTKSTVSDFHIFEKFLIYSTTDGNIVKQSLTTEKQERIKLTDNFVLNGLFIESKLILGTFDGSILVLNLETLKIEKELKIHKRSVLSLKNVDGEFYSSGIDKTIRKWKFN
ncbi:hypothetical protein M0G43_03000 [Subsaxibacter sp. CAU 1640]|uniref:WD40 repeat domain-containing protein n=1 Tax=Subsaxibacter sp. CAU 1640 TaxID=2933271 RepID=UPI00200406AF|nr:WD40 repeat domain-containing protein [Subsaxibacter sp. CAU 1640]MCK7589534.1 hypothetical protein [Subsaxibacter sp. CAU 1640]